jgi:hypothetical protein
MKLYSTCCWLHMLAHLLRNRLPVSLQAVALLPVLLLLKMGGTGG